METVACIQEGNFEVVYFLLIFVVEILAASFSVLLMFSSQSKVKFNTHLASINRGRYCLKILREYQRSIGWIAKKNLQTSFV